MPLADRGGSGWCLLVSLGATLSVKWVGLFTMAWVGSLTALQLWVLLGDSKTVTPVCISEWKSIDVQS